MTSAELDNLVRIGKLKCERSTAAAAMVRSVQLLSGRMRNPG